MAAEVSTVGQGSVNSETAILSSKNDSSDVEAQSSGEPPSYHSIPGVVPLYKGKQPGPPPSYDDTTNPEAPPPAYQSLYGQVREAKRSSSGIFDFILKVVLIILGTLGCTVLIATTVVIPIAMIVIGSMYLHDCPVQRYIPIYLIVGGVFGVLKNFRGCFTECNKDENGEKKQKADESLLSCFLLAWFIAGCVWIYGVYPPNFDDPNDARYCHKTVYYFSFWLVTSAYILMGLMTCCICCFTAATVLLSNSTSE